MEQRRIPSSEEIEETEAHTVSRLLATPTPEAMEDFYGRLANKKYYSGLQVKFMGPEMGKGVFASKNFKKDELVLKEHVLVGAQHAQNKGYALVCSFCFCFIGSIEMQIGRHLLSARQEEKHMSSDSGEGASVSLDARSSSDSFDGDNVDCIEGNTGETSLPLSLIESLLSKSLQLPWSDHFTLPVVVKCIGGCEDEYFCSDTCAKSAWESFHSLLCTGPNSLCKDKNMLRKFQHHADETNDIFHLAAKVISSTLLRVVKLEKETMAACCESTSLAYRKKDATEALLMAWEPFSMGHKRLWWESVALPSDLQPKDELEFRNQIKELASTSLDLLKGAIFQEDYASLFSLQVYGSIIGMFELNNLDLVVASPVEDYFIFIDDLPVAEKVEALKVTRPILDALGDEYDIPCQGTAFFSLHSCINHSCFPNIRAFKRDEDKDGQAVLLASRPIKEGDQITISYIDENCPLEERRAMLKDYGFTCTCIKCAEESALNMTWKADQRSNPAPSPC